MRIKAQRSSYNVADAVRDVAPHAHRHHCRNRPRLRLDGMGADEPAMCMVDYARAGCAASPMCDNGADAPVTVGSVERARKLTLRGIDAR